jgi:hypothetical protein
MAWRRNRGLSPDLRFERWRRWRWGQTVTEIAAALVRQPGSVFGTIRDGGGHPPRWDRQEFGHGLAVGDSLNAIESRLGRSPGP